MGSFIQHLGSLLRTINRGEEHTPERFGMCLTVASPVTMLSFSDLAIGILPSKSDVPGKAEVKAARHFVSNAFFLLPAIPGFVHLPQKGKAS